jgi:hypothetical protein
MNDVASLLDKLKSQRGKMPTNSKHPQNSNDLLAQLAEQMDREHPI